MAIAAFRECLGLDDGWPALQAALSKAGLQPDVLVWDDPTVEWQRFDLVTVMYTWGYVTCRAAFLRWAETVGAETLLVNGVPQLRWNSHKGYLADLAALGLPIVPTIWARPGEPWHPPAEDYVIKPTVASGGLGAARYRATAPAVADDHVRRLHAAGQSVMIQPYLASVDQIGETALVFIGGSFSHAVTKAGLLAADAGETERLWERQVIVPAHPTLAHRRVAEATMAAIAAKLGPSAYGRVDLVNDHNGNPRVLEVELVEPSLFLTTADGAVERLATVYQQTATPTS